MFANGWLWFLQPSRAEATGSTNNPLGTCPLGLQQLCCLRSLPRCFHPSSNVHAPVSRASEGLTGTASVFSLGVVLGCSAAKCRKRRRHRTTSCSESSRTSARDSRLDEARPFGADDACFCESRGFDPEEWRRHSAPSRYVTELIGLFDGTTTRRVLPVVSVLALFSVLVEQYDQIQAQDSILPKVTLPITPFELTAPLLGLLLVFRTDKSYDRYKEGCEAAWEISGRLKDLLRGLLSNTSDRRPRALADVDHLCSLTVHYHTWLCTSYLLQEGSDASGTDSAKVLKHRLGYPDNSFLAPAHVQLALSQGINQVPDLNEQQRQGFDTILWEVNSQLSHCERLLRSPIPLEYTRSTVRFLWLWLTLLPFALIGSFVDFERTQFISLEIQIEVPAIVFFIGLLFLSLEDVAVQIEEPFAVQKPQLQRLSDWFVMEAAELREMASREHDRCEH